MEIQRQKFNDKMQYITSWPWTLTYDLNLQSQPSQGQGQPSCKISRPKVKHFKQDVFFIDLNNQLGLVLGLGLALRKNKLGLGLARLLTLFGGILEEKVSTKVPLFS